MNRLLTILSMAAFGLTACGNNKSAADVAVTTKTQAPLPEIATGYSDVDPFCGMVRDSTWTDYTLYKGDTMWFCAAPEMKAFIANPEKYLSATRVDSSQNHHQ